MAACGASVQGSRHLQTGDPCQDAWQSIPFEGGMVVAVADGLSSASHSKQGAMIAVSESCKYISTLRNPANPTQIMRDTFSHIYNVLMRSADASGLNPSSFATTLIIAYLSDGILTTGHIGDGIVAGILNGTPIIISPPARSEYVNETASLTQSDWESHLRMRSNKNVNCCIIATDGCQSALSVRKGDKFIPYEPFITPLISFVRKKMMYGGDCRSDIENLLTSPRMLDLSDDDKTLVVLFRIEEMQNGKLNTLD